MDIGGRRGAVGAEDVPLWDSELLRKRRRARFSADLVLLRGRLGEDLNLLRRPDSLRALLCPVPDFVLEIGVVGCCCGVELKRCKYLRVMLLTDANDDEFCEVAID